MWPNFREHDESPVDGLRLSPTLEATRSDHVAFVAFPLPRALIESKALSGGKGAVTFGESLAEINPLGWRKTYGNTWVWVNTY